MIFYSLNAELKFHTSGIRATRGKAQKHHCTLLVLVSQVARNFIWHWQLAVAAGSPLRAAGIGAMHRVGLEDLRRLSETKQLSFHSSERDLHSFSPKLLSTKLIFNIQSICQPYFTETTLQIEPVFTQLK